MVEWVQYKQFNDVPKIQYFENTNHFEPKKFTCINFQLFINSALCLFM